jgi:hypothetical protein
MSDETLEVVNEERSWLTRKNREQKHERKHIWHLIHKWQQESERKPPKPKKEDRNE